MKTLIYSLITLLFLLSTYWQVLNAQCTEFAEGPWSNFSLAPCAEDCALESRNFQIIGNEAYLVNQVEPGAEYQFTFCDGYNENRWAAEITVVEYDSDNNAVVSAGVIATTQDCALIFTIPNSYTQAIDILMIVSVVGDCGGSLLEENNGTPSFGCGPNGGQAACVLCDDPSISAGVVTAPNTQICEGMTLLLSVNGAVVPYSDATNGISGFVWVVSETDISGSTNPNGEDTFVGNFVVTPSPPTTPLNFVNNGTELSFGTYYITPVVFGNAMDPSGNGSFNNFDLAPNCTFTGTSLQIDLLPNADPNCQEPTGPCLDFNTSYTDLNDGGNCNTPVVITDVPVWTNEAYFITNVQLGATYELDICTGYDSNNWTAQLTAVQVDPDTDQLLQVLGNTVGCQLSFTVPEDLPEPHSILLIIADDSNCGGPTRQINNGFPSFGCTDDGSSNTNAPANNKCDGAINIAAIFGGAVNNQQSTQPFDNTHATNELLGTAEPDCFVEDGFSLNNTLWFSFVGDGQRYFIETTDCNGTLGEDYIDLGDTQIQIYTGSCDNLTPVPNGCNDDGPNAFSEGPYPAGLIFQTEVGVTYQLMVDGFDFEGETSRGQFCIVATALGEENNCLADAGQLVSRTNTSFCGADIFIPEIANFQPTGLYNYYFLLTDGAPNYNIAAISNEYGEFIFEDLNLEESEVYTVHGISILADDLDVLIDGNATTALQIEESINAGTICADLLFNDPSNYSITFCPVGIEETLNTNDFIFQVAPNPTKDILHITYQNANVAPVTLTVYDVSGKRVAQKEYHHAETVLFLDLQTYPAGTYWLQLVNAEQTISQKIVKLN